MIRLSTWLLLALCIAPLLAESNIEDRRQELEAIRRDIEKNRAEIGKLSSKEADISKKLRRIDNDIALMTRYVRKLEEQEKALAHDIEKTQTELIKTSNNLSDRKQFLRERVRWMYKKGRFDDLDLLFSGHAISDFFRRNALFRYITDSDRSLIKTISRQQRMFTSTKQRLEGRLDDVHIVKQEKEREQESLEKQKQARAKLLVEVQGKKSAYLKQVKELEKRQAEINRLMATLDKARRSRPKRQTGAATDMGAFGKLRGTLPWPVKGEVSKHYGTNVHPVYGTKTINNGLDIETYEGAPVKAVAAGEVAYTGVLSGLGTIVVIEHSDGFYTLYANLGRTSVQKGNEVKAGHGVGSVGSGGEFHFELRRERQVLNPEDWLE